MWGVYFSTWSGNNHNYSSRFEKEVGLEDSHTENLPTKLHLFQVFILKFLLHLSSDVSKPGH